MLNLRNQSVNVTRLELLTALRANLAQHLTEYEQAILDYKTKVVEELSAALARANADDFAKVNVSVQKPSCHKRDFEEVIEMLEMSVDEVIELDKEAFRAYIKGEWPWKESFTQLMASYKS